MRPEIVAAPTAFNCAVLDKCVLFKREYTKPLFLFNSHAETIWGSWYRTNLSLELDREYVDTPDGGVVTLDALKHVITGLTFDVDLLAIGWCCCC